MNRLVKLLLCGVLLVAGLAWGTVETVSYISDFNTSLPASGDSVAEGAQHIRNLKTALKNTFPNITGAVNPTQTELNYSVGVTSAIQTQLAARALSSDTGLHFIASVTTTTATATITFVTGIDSTYDEYELHIINAVPAGAGAPFLRTSADAGVTWNSSSTDYDCVYSYINATSINVTNCGATATSMTLGPTGGSTTTTMAGFSAIVRVYDPAGTTFNKRFQWTASASSGAAGGSASAMYYFAGSGQREATAAINGFEFGFSGTTINAGAKFKLYGVRKS